MDTTTFVVGAGILFFLVTCWAIMDVAQKDFGSMEKKILWGFIAWLPFVGFILYIAFGYKKGKKGGKIGDIVGDSGPVHEAESEKVKI